MNFFKRKPKINPSGTFLQAAREKQNLVTQMNAHLPLATAEQRLYESVREGVPLVDSAILKIIRLALGFSVKAENQAVQGLLDNFTQTVNVGGVNCGLEAFMAGYLDDLLTYGNAVGEMVLNRNQQFVGLYLADSQRVELCGETHPLQPQFYAVDEMGGRTKIKNQELVLFTALNPKSGEYRGTSILRGLPFMSNILFKVYHSIGQNFDRIGNVRYAVTYKPSNDALDKAYAKERAQMIAREWSEGMRSGADGQVRDFISVGEVDIKVIGADNQMIDTQIPVRHMLEQIVAKLGIPPFLLGLSWSSTERMSKQQTDILTTEMAYYRRLLTPIIMKICQTYLRLNGYVSDLYVEWDTINLKDEVETAQAHYYEAQAKALEQSL